jgi:tRNA (Thr-GGU) A37 N-methylase
MRISSVSGLAPDGADMLDGTPLLDIKPYVPAFDCFAVNRVGWYQDKIAQGAVADDRFEDLEEDNHRR